MAKGCPTGRLTDMAARERRHRFATLYVADPKRNAAAAAEAAGYGTGDTAKNAGRRALKQPDVIAIIEQEMESRAARLRINADWLLLKMVGEVEADIKDLYDEAGNIKAVHEWPLVWRQGLVAGFEVTELFDGAGKERKRIGRIRKVKLADRTRIKELIGRHIDVGAFKDKVEHSVDDNLATLIARSMDIKD